MGKKKEALEEIIKEYKGIEILYSQMKINDDGTPKYKRMLDRCAFEMNLMKMMLMGAVGATVSEELAEKESE